MLRLAHAMARPIYCREWITLTVADQPEIRSARFVGPNNKSVKRGAAF
jgi:hypothetical protein